MIKVSTYCHHRWQAVPKIGVRKYMCTECSMFGFQLKGDPLHGIREHSIEVSKDLLDQYIELGQPTMTYMEPEKRAGPKPGPVRMHEYDGCEHNWVPAPEYSDILFPRLKCTKCPSIGRELATGEIAPFSRDYAGSLRRYQCKQHLEGEPLCEHEWELAPLLGTNHVNRYECKKCKWLGFRVGHRVPIQAHPAYSVARIRSENGLRKEPDEHSKESIVAEGTKEEIHQEQESP